jgi:Flp pilus assembly protein TadD
MSSKVGTTLKILLWFAGPVLGAVLGVLGNRYYTDPDRRAREEQERRRIAPVELLDRADDERRRLTENDLASAVDKYKSLLPVIDDAQFPLNQANKLRVYLGLSRAYADWATLKFWRGLSTGDFPEKAQSYALKAVATPPETPESLIALAFAYDAAEAGKEKSATKAKVIEILNKGINNLEVQYLAANCEANEEAKSFLDKLQAENVSDLRILVDVVLDFAKLATAHPTEKEIYIKRGEEFLARAVHVNRDNPMVLFAQGYLSATKENYIEARDYYLKAVALEPEFPRARNNLGFTYAADRDYINAKKQFGAACQALGLPNTSRRRYLLNFAAASLETGNSDEACWAWRQVSEVPGANENPETFVGLAMCENLSQRKNEARAYFCHAVQLGKASNLDLANISWFNQHNAGPKELEVAKALIQITNGKCSALRSKP